MTIADVADRARVSPSVVSAVLNDNQTAVRFSQKTRERILKTVSQLGFQRNPISVALRTAKKRAIGIYLGDPERLLAHAYGAMMVAAVQKACASRGYSAVLMPLTQIKCDFRLIDGLLIMGRSTGDEDAIREAARSVITVGARLPPEFNAVPIDESAMSVLLRKSHEMAASYLYGMGHRHIAVVNLKWTSLPAEIVFQEVARKMALEARITALTGKWYDHSYPYLAEALNDRELPTAFYVFDHDIAQYLINALSRRGVSVPGDVSVFSRETFETKKFNALGVTGITINRDASFHSLVNQFIDVLEGKNPGSTIIMPMQEARLIERLSCAPPRNASRKLKWTETFS